MNTQLDYIVVTGSAKRDLIRSKNDLVTITILCGKFPRRSVNFPKNSDGL